MSQDRTARVLIADASESARSELREALQPTPLQIGEAGGVAAALGALDDFSPDLVLCEVVLPDGSGFGLCRLLREHPRHRELPIVLVSRWSSEIDRILAFECGADDFLARPFFGRELSSRVCAVLRRAAHRPRDERAGDERRAAPASAAAPGLAPIRAAGRVLDLTPKEAAILVLLASSSGAVRSRRQLIEAIWSDGDAPSDRCIDSHVKSLRRKLGPAGASVETVRGVGYRFAPHPELELG